jgi:hypothetical protein
MKKKKIDHEWFQLQGSGLWAIITLAKGEKSVFTHSPPAGVLWVMVNYDS